MDPSGSSSLLERVLSTTRLRGVTDTSPGHETGMILTMTLQRRALFTGDGVSFLYPDLKTGLQGRFVAATMLAAGLIFIVCYGSQDL